MKQKKSVEMLVLGICPCLWLGFGEEKTSLRSDAIKRGNSDCVLVLGSALKMSCSTEATNKHTFTHKAHKCKSNMLTTRQRK